MATTKPLTILIIGAGLGGCTAAFCFARHGHAVTVLEQHSTFSPKGSGLMIRPGASRVLINWGLAPDFEVICDTSPSSVIRSLTTGEILQRNVPVDISDSPDWGTDRERVIGLMYRKAGEVGARFEFDVTVVDVVDGVDEAVAVLRDGRRLSADLIMAADGIRSRIRSQILSDVKGPIDPILSNNTFFGVKVFGEKLRDSDTPARALTDSKHLNIYMAPDRYVVARWSERANSYGGGFATIEDVGQTKLWDEDGDIDFVRRKYADANPQLRSVLEIADKCDRWKLAEMPDLLRWTSRNGRIILLGDSAHGMLPNVAQGYSQIVEDIACLEKLLDIKGSDQMREVTSLWQDIRKPRVERIKAFAKWNTQVMLGQMKMPGVSEAAQRKTKTSIETIKSLKDTKPDMYAQFHTSAFLKWAQHYDVVAETRRYLKSMDARL